MLSLNTNSASLYSVIPTKPLLHPVNFDLIISHWYKLSSEYPSESVVEKGTPSTVTEFESEVDNIFDTNTT